MGGERIPSLRWGSFATVGRNKQNKKRLPLADNLFFIRYSTAWKSDKCCFR